ncbi:SIS domain-containing protein [Spirochaeta thermophila]|nr:SIS domain-containing protein [Spirochaeta thermophila]
MKRTQDYMRFSLVKEMAETPEVIRRFPVDEVREEFSLVGERGRLLLTGEGSSRIFPAGNVRASLLREGSPVRVEVEGAMQAREYTLDGWGVFVASNSGKTAEGVRLLASLREKARDVVVGAVVGRKDSPIGRGADAVYELRCGPEEAVAATKSVVEQAFFYDVVLRGEKAAARRDELAALIEEVFWMDLPEELVRPLVGAPVLYFAGRNNGVAEELTLKTNEITRKKSDYLEGTYAVHGIEEVMSPEEVVVLIDPFEEEEDKFASVLEEGVGVKVLAIAHRETRFPTILLPQVEQGCAPYLQLVAGWNLLVEVGVRSGIHLDKPQRARKVGNEFVG